MPKLKRRERRADPEEIEYALDDGFGAIEEACSVHNRESIVLGDYDLNDAESLQVLVDEVGVMLGDFEEAVSKLEDLRGTVEDRMYALDDPDF